VRDHFTYTAGGQANTKFVIFNLFGYADSHSSSPLRQISYMLPQKEPGDN
jgi:hypothetical protein